MVPLDVVDVVPAEDVGHPVEEVVAHLRQAHVQHQLLAAHDLIVRAKYPVGMRPEEIGVAVDHLGFEPEAEGHAQAPDMLDQRGQPIRIFARIHGPITQRARVIVARAEPAVIQHEALRAKVGGTAGDLFQFLGIVVEINRFPTVVVNRARPIGVREFHDPVPQMPLERDRAAVDPGIREGGVKRGRREMRGRFRFCPAGVAELDLPPPVGQFFGHHTVPAGPAVMKGAGLPRRMGGARRRQQKTGKMFVPRAPGPVLARAHACRPGRGNGLKLTAPATGEIDHFPRVLRRGENRRGQPVQREGFRRVDLGPGRDHVGFGVDPEKGGIA